MNCEGSDNKSETLRQGGIINQLWKTEEEADCTTFLELTIHACMELQTNTHAYYICTNVCDMACIWLQCANTL